MEVCGTCACGTETDEGTVMCGLYDEEMAPDDSCDEWSDDEWGDD